MKRTFASVARPMTSSPRPLSRDQLWNVHRIGSVTPSIVSKSWYAIACGSFSASSRVLPKVTMYAAATSLPSPPG